MRFTHPWLLLALAAAVPVLVAAHAGRRRRRASAVAWGNPAVVATLAARRTPVRWMAPGFAVVSLLAATLALAGPEYEARDTERAATVVLAVDVSLSMEATDVTPSRLDAAQAAAVAFLDGVASYVRVGVVAFAGEATTLVSPTTDRDEARRAVTTLRTAQATALGDALRTSLIPAQIDAAAADDPDGYRRRGPVTVVFLSDGANTVGSDPLEAARTASALGVVVHTIALGTPTGSIDLFDPTTGTSTTAQVPPDVETLAAVAAQTGGEFFDVADAATLRAVYEGIADSLVEVRSFRPLWRIMLAAALVAASVACSVAVYRRRFP